MQVGIELAKRAVEMKPRVYSTGPATSYGSVPPASKRRDDPASVLGGEHIGFTPFPFDRMRLLRDKLSERAPPALHRAASLLCVRGVAPLQVSRFSLAYVAVVYSAQPKHCTAR
jgi:hypothetical protein